MLIFELDRKHVLVDPTSFEEPLLDSSLSIILGDNDDIVSISQLGSLLVSVEEKGGQEVQRDALAGCIASAKQRRAEVVKALN